MEYGKEYDKKETKLRSEKTKKTHHIYVIFDMIFMMLLKASFNEK